MRTIGNNGNVAVNFLHNSGLIKDGMTAEQLEVELKPLMINENHLKNDGFWEDVFYRAEELGYKLQY